MNDVPVITIDGPSGTGKGTLCCYLAKHLGWHFLDSGALYRVVAHAAGAKNTALDNEIELAKIASELNVRFELEDNEVMVVLDDTDVSQAIRTEGCGSDASRIAALAPVRQALLARQRAFRQAPGLIADGRDMGTVVFPHATLKFFLQASPGERAKRRYKQLKQKGIGVNLTRLSADIALRDARDKERTVSPLKPAKDAIVIDSTELDVDEVCEQVMGIVRNKLSNEPESRP